MRTHLAQEIRSFHVQCHGKVEVLLGCLLEILHGRHASIRNQDVDLPEFVDGLLDQLLHLGHDAHVGFDGKSSVVPDGFDQLFCRFGIGGVTDNHIGSVFGETKSRSFSDAFGSSCDQGYFSGERCRRHVDLAWRYEER